MRDHGSSDLAEKGCFAHQCSRCMSTWCQKGLSACVLVTSRGRQCSARRMRSLALAHAVATCSAFVLPAPTLVQRHCVPLIRGGLPWVAPAAGAYDAPRWSLSCEASAQHHCGDTSRDRPHVAKGLQRAARRLTKRLKSVGLSAAGAVLEPLLAVRSFLHGARESIRDDRRRGMIGAGAAALSVCPVRPCGAMVQPDRTAIVRPFRRSRTGAKDAVKATKERAKAVVKQVSGRANKEKEEAERMRILAEQRAGMLRRATAQGIAVTVATGLVAATWHKQRVQSRTWDKLHQVKNEEQEEDSRPPSGQELAAEAIDVAHAPSWNEVVDLQTRTYTLRPESSPVKVLTDNEQAWRTYLELLSSAQESITLVIWYVFKDDYYTNKVLEILSAKIDQGVEVTLVHPALNLQEFELQLAQFGESGTNAFTQALTEKGARVINFTEEVPGHGTHRKALIVDHRKIIMGSRNLMRLYYEPIYISDNRMQSGQDGNSVSSQDEKLAREQPHMELDIVLEGPEAQAIESMLVSNKDGVIDLGDGKMFWQCSPISQHHPFNTIEEQFVSLITAASTSIVITNLSLLIRQPIKKALQRAVARGVSITVITNGMPTIPQLQLYTTETISKDVRCQIYQNTSPHLLHCKFATFDESIAVVGSFNFDEWSYTKNAECMLAIKDPQLAKDFNSYAAWIAKNKCIPRGSLPDPQEDNALRELQAAGVLLLTQLGY